MRKLIDKFHEKFIGEQAEYQQEDQEPTFNQTMEYLGKFIVDNWKIWIAIMILQGLTKLL